MIAAIESQFTKECHAIDVEGRERRAERIVRQGGARLCNDDENGKNEKSDTQPNYGAKLSRPSLCHDKF